MDVFDLHCRGSSGIFESKSFHSFEGAGQRRSSTLSRGSKRRIIVLVGKLTNNVAHLLSSFVHCCIAGEMFSF